jgi:hypothetical protein
MSMSDCIRSVMTPSHDIFRVRGKKPMETTDPDF